MLSNYKFSLRDLFIGLLILVPVFALAILVYNPQERAAVARDLERKNTINVLARIAEPYFKQNKAYPTDLSVLENLPGNAHEFNYQVSADGQDIIVYDEVESLAWRHFCPDNKAFILYSSEGNRTAISCTDSPVPGPQEFVD